MVLLQSFTDVVLVSLANLAAYFVLILGIMWMIFGIYEGKRRGSYKERKVKDWDFKITKFLKGLTYLGFIVGIICIVSGVAGIMLHEPPSVAYPYDDVNYFTSILLIIVGVFTFLKPANDMPIATMVALLAATAILIVLASIITPTSKLFAVIDVFVNAQIVMIIVFIVVFAIIGGLIKFYSKGIMIVSKAISWPPLAILISLFCFLQGLLLLSGISII